MRKQLTAVTTAFLLAAVTTACSSSSNGSSGSGSGSGKPQHPSALVGTVGKNDAFSIALTDPAGNAITNLAAGTYKLTIHDLSSIHNFHVLAPVNVSTTVAEKTTKTFTLTLKPGNYSFQCDPHASSMHGSFKVS